MTSQVFYRKYRPQTLNDVVGQEQVTQTLRNALANGRVSHAYLFCGPRGTGKTSTARILAKAVNCLTNGKGDPCNTCAMCVASTEGSALDVIEIDAASNRGIDDIRELREKVNYAPNQAKYKVYIIDEVHMLSTPAANALLKTLEEPPAHVIFILATTEAHSLPATILSRCQRFDFHRISQAATAARLAYICAAEGIKIDTESLRLIARNSAGGLRDAENLLEQLWAYYGADISLAQVKNILGITGDSRVKELAKYIVNNDISAGIATVNAVNSDGLDLRQFNRELVEYLRELLLVKSGAGQAVELTAEDMTELKGLAEKASLQQVLKAIKLFGQLELSFDNYSTLPLELALVDCSLPDERVIERAEAPKAARPAAPRPAAPRPMTPQTRPTAPPVAAQRTDPPRQSAPAKPAPLPAEPVVADKPLEPLVPGKELEYLTENWRRLLNEASASYKTSPTPAVLKSARPTTVEGDVVTVAFTAEVLKEKVEKLENQKVADEIISKFLGRPYHIRCVYQPKSNHLVRAAQSLGAQIVNVEEKWTSEKT